MTTRRTLVALILLTALSGCKTPTKPPPSAPARPLIGLTSVYKTAENGASAAISCTFTYVAAIAENGGTPVILPTCLDDEIIRQYVQILDGLVLIGGDDIPPQVYGQEPHPTTKIMPQQRYDFESKLIAAWLATGKPTLGICLGMQFTNVVSGGTLIQDIPSQIGASVNHRGKGAHHRVNIDPESHLALILGAHTANVYSHHHQAADEVGKNLKIVARSPDGVAEAAERTDGPFGLFVQWHPEAMAETAHRDAIYGALVDACKSAAR
ncbi:MAG: gamma-glutamyl-gamma-aminobutyrate hydrolase family protein [Phycisphaerae bacterium]|nr:gamma-glutamyl-gamma-aminobutyrate hydrolase family protein [Phycisphaerae bacterium]